MRAALACLALLACAHREPYREPSFSFDTQPEPPRPWPAAGMCVDFGAGCRVYTPGEIEAIRQTVIAYLDAQLPARPDLARARELAGWPISTPFIGGYRAMTRSYPGQSGPVLRLEGISHRDNNIDRGFELYLTESTPGTWTVISDHTLINDRPHID
jgi:hypothetical protein